MVEAPGFFTDGQAYERLMGRWSRAAGEVFLDWLSLPKGLNWLDVGCGTGTFTELVIDRCAPSNISAIDPSESQINYACSGPAASHVTLRRLVEGLLSMGVDAPAGGGLKNTRIEELRILFERAGLDQVATRTIEVEVSYQSFDDYWSAQTGFANQVVQPIRKMSKPDVARLQEIVPRGVV